jgi:hypothetical protein
MKGKEPVLQGYCCPTVLSLTSDKAKHQWLLLLLLRGTAAAAAVVEFIAAGQDCL